MIEHLQGFPGNSVGFACKGHVTAREYESVLVPRVDQALEAHDKVRVYHRIDDGFEGIDPGAVRDDIKTGMQHRRQEMTQACEWTSAR